jgi:pyridoxine 4-dehydrogenase
MSDPLGPAYLTHRPAVVTAAGAEDVTPAQIGLAWLLAHAPNVC